jgi:ATP synthase protein I
MDYEPPASGQDEDKKNEEIRGTLREYGPYLSLGFQLAAAVIVFYFIGTWVDKHYGTSPIGMLVGATIGMVGGFIKFFKSINSLIEQEDRVRKRNKHEN